MGVRVQVGFLRVETPLLKDTGFRSSKSHSAEGAWSGGGEEEDPPGSTRS